MHETFKNVSIFITFVFMLFPWNAARDYLTPHFRFDYGQSLLMVVWSSGVVILFHLLYFYFGKSEKMAYIGAILSAGIIGALLYYGELSPY